MHKINVVAVVILDQIFVQEVRLEKARPSPDLLSYFSLQCVTLLQDCLCVGQRLSDTAVRAAASTFSMHRPTTLVRTVTVIVQQWFDSLADLVSPMSPLSFRSASGPQDQRTDRGISSCNSGLILLLI